MRNVLTNMRMHWALFVLAGASLNALNNYGFKMMAGQTNTALFTALVFAVTAIVFLVYGLGVQAIKLRTMMEGTTPVLFTAMGLAKVVTMILFVGAFTAGGPISLVDPMWACVYSLGSVILGVGIAREKPSVPALLGIGLFIAGAFLMARG